MAAPDEPASNSRLEVLRTALDDVKAPFCSGTLEVDDSNLLLFYGNNLGTAGRMDFKKATDVELKNLAEACERPHLGSTKEWIVDSGRLAEVKKEDDPEQAHIVFATFFSDVEHEVTPVKSGYRVTLTYNLYFDTSSNPTVDHSLQVTEKTIPSEAGVFKTALANLLQDKTFLPEGGSFGFGLYHQYPVDKSSENIRDLHKFLKGRDALIMQVCEEFRLDANIWLLYGDEDEVQFLSKRVIGIDGVGPEETFSSVALDYSGGRQVRDPDDDDDDGNIVWVRNISDLNTVKEQYAAYGNSCHLGCAYANVCLVVDIGPPGDRSKGEAEKEQESSEQESSEQESSEQESI